ncbi:hypothetical protein HC081234_17160 [Helicobacter cinaedi]|nr:hypothetical protein HC081234_17160 [Helicobacter cinaedi]
MFMVCLAFAQNLESGLEPLAIFICFWTCFDCAIVGII